MGEPEEPVRPLVPVLVGPTGVGKTAVAVELGKLVPVTVISADARQIYRHLTVGTAKPSPDVLRELPHVGIDLIEPGERYSAGRFARDAAVWLGAIQAGRRLPLVVGGTGFYVRALAEGLFREPPLDPLRRESLRAWTARLPVARVAHWAARLDRRVSGGGRQRAARAIEIALLTGRPLSWWQQDARDSGIMHPWYIHLTLPREALTRRIAERTDRMLEAGLVQEVKALLARGLPPDAPGLDGVGYREVVAMLTGALAPAELRDAIVRATRRYAKRQETWFRNQLPREGGRGKGEGVWVLDATGSPEALASAINERWSRLPLPASPFPLPGL